jgi:hypothetical protein
MTALTEIGDGRARAHVDGGQPIHVPKDKHRLAYPNGVEREPKRRQRRFKVLTYYAAATNARLFARLARALSGENDAP